MGYSATLIDVRHEGDGDPMVIEASRVPEVMLALRAAEEGMGHISWCDPVDEYVKTCQTPAHAAARILSDFGWDGTDVNGGGDIQIGWWGGDKIGSSWKEVRDAIALGVNPALKITWILSGEDSEMWAEVLHDGEAETRAITVEVE